ncbi:MAG: sigma 54-interacting transcriptional regulator [Balneolales bacterium]|nr:sigma 54-interacting transcriptional regulator [Balneolales bacterium]
MGLLKENIAPIQQSDILYDSGFQTKSPLMKDIYQKVQNIARHEKHLVLIGEIGVGKRSLADAIHRYSSRSNGPFHSFYCINTNEEEFKDAFWEQLRVENEHVLLRYDLLEKTSNGILYLNKFSELTTSLMLNIIDSYIHGCNQLFRYNLSTSPRLIISISQDTYQHFMKTEAWDKLLTELNPISIMVPPLRERREDIPAFIKLFIEEARYSEPSWSDLSISDEAVQECISHRWPGNVRQLKNAIVQGALLSQGGLIQCQHLPFSMNWQLPYQDD